MCSSRAGTADCKMILRYGGAQILGVAVAKDVQVARAAVTARFNGSRGKLLRTLARGQAARRIVVGTRVDEQFHEVR